MRLTLDEAIKKHGGFNVVCGGGDDSTMMIAELYDRGYEPDHIIFCDTGNEMPHTYKFIAFLSKWMMERNWSKLVIQKKYNANGEVINVFDENYKNGRMPPVLYGFKTCSHRFKIEVADRYLAIANGFYTKKTSSCFDDEFLSWREAVNTPHNVIPVSELYNHYKANIKPQVFWKGWNKKIVKAVGLNADEISRISGWVSDENFETVYPLDDWDIGSKEAVDTVVKVGLYMPGKSSCFMCPNMTAEEIVFMHDHYPLMFHKSIAMEYNVIEHGNDIAEVSRLFVEGGGISQQLPSKMVKKTDRVIDIEKTIASMSHETLVNLGLVDDASQYDLFGTPTTKLVVRKVIEPTNFVGLARSKSWREVLSLYQMTGQMDLSVGGGMCASGACGL